MGFGRKEFEVMSGSAPQTNPIVTCPQCGGYGEVRCSSCKGKGVARCPQCGGRGKQTLWGAIGGQAAGKQGVAVTARTEQCLTCQGSGWLTTPCPSCGGSGKVGCCFCKGSGEVTKNRAVLYKAMKIGCLCTVLLVVLVAIIAVAVQTKNVGDLRKEPQQVGEIEPRGAVVDTGKKTPPQSEVPGQHPSGTTESPGATRGSVAVKPLGSAELLMQILESHVRALAAADTESTSLVKQNATEEVVAKTQERLDANVFAITVVIEDADVVDRDENIVRLSFNRHASLTGVDKEDERLYFPTNFVDLKMDRSMAAKVKPGSKLVFQGRVLAGSPRKGGGFPGEAFYYKKHQFAVTAYNCRVAD